MQQHIFLFFSTRRYCKPNLDTSSLHTALMYVSIGTLKTINFSFVPNGTLVVYSVPLFKHNRVVCRKKDNYCNHISKPRREWLGSQGQTGQSNPSIITSFTAKKPHLISCAVTYFKWKTNLFQKRKTWKSPQKLWPRLWSVNKKLYFFSYSFSPPRFSECLKWRLLLSVESVRGGVTYQPLKSCFDLSNSRTFFSKILFCLFFEWSAFVWHIFSYDCS